MAVTAPAPRIGKTTGVPKPVKRKPVLTGLINRG